MLARMEPVWQTEADGVRLDVSTRTYPNVFAVIDSEDYEYLSQWHWYAMSGKGKTLYVYRSEASLLVPMHRQILHTNEIVDHIDGNGLDNRKRNLRLSN